MSEIKIFGHRHLNPTFYDNLAVKLYPNPASDIINIRIDEPTLSPDFIRIINLSGKIVFQDHMNPDIRELQIPINLDNGIYVVQLGSGDLTLFTQKLIVALK
ncbi:MAG: T9SS type A sorting domain-containing protein [Nitrosomonadales bacterium]|nr:MAG: T9SS type A sorting domain-containing protein [Nitrosomonadales bacterium]